MKSGAEARRLIRRGVAGKPFEQRSQQVGHLGEGHVRAESPGEPVSRGGPAEEDVVAMRGPGLPKTVEEAVNWLIFNMPLRARTELAKHDEAELRLLHFTFGAFIRNQFEIWSGNVELLNDCRRLSGITFMSPDDAVSFIIKKLWEQLQKTHKLRVVK